MEEKESKNLKKIAYYPGCSLKSTAVDFNVSIEKVLNLLGIEYEEIADWNCCGTTPASNISDELVATLSARNLLLADEMGLKEILCPCISCYNKLLKASYYINNNKGELKNLREEKKRDSILRALKEMGFDTEKDFSIKIYSIIEFLNLQKELIGKKYRELEGKRNKNSKGYSILNSLKPVCYYGCAMLRPEGVPKFDDIENPTSMEEILKMVDMECEDFQFKTECCGAILSLTNKDEVLRLSGEILDSAAMESGANSMIVFCQLCQQNLDLRQTQINKYNKKHFHMPIIFITQILGMALGLSPEEVMVDRLFVSPAITGKKN